MSDESLIQQANRLAFDNFMWQLARPPETVRIQGERIDIPPLPIPTQDNLTEICQLFGEPIYVRLDWRVPEIAKETLDRIRFTIKDAFSRAYGWFEEPPKDKSEVLRDVNTKAGG